MGGEVYIETEIRKINGERKDDCIHTYVHRLWCREGVVAKEDWNTRKQLNEIESQV